MRARTAPTQELSEVRPGLPSQDSRCPLCSGPVKKAFSPLLGYHEPSFYTVMACAECGVSYTLPMSIDEQLYDRIYQNAWKTPGYHEYWAFAEEVLRRRDPLVYLESASPVYWAMGCYRGEDTVW